MKAATKLLYVKTAGGPMPAGFVLTVGHLDDDTAWANGEPMETGDAGIESLKRVAGELGEKVREFVAHVRVGHNDDGQVWIAVTPEAVHAAAEKAALDECQRLKLGASERNTIYALAFLTAREIADGLAKEGAAQAERAVAKPDEQQTGR